MKPKKERPSALSDSIFKAKLEQAPERGGEEIPVHNTFIQFGVPPSSDSEKKPLSTAPAWIGPSLQSIVQAQTEPGAQAPPVPGAEAPPEAVGKDAESDQPLGSPKKVSVAQSADTSGIPEWSPTAVATVGPTSSGFGVEGAQDDEDGEDDDDADSGDQLGAADRPPAAPSGPLPSIGSAQHAEGACKRCCFFPKGRCQNGYDCEFCHFEHEKRKRKKKKKGASARRDAAGSDSDDDSNAGEAAPGAAPGAEGAHSSAQGAGSAWPSAEQQPIGPMRNSVPLTAPPLLPPRGLPLPSEPPPPAPNPVQAAGIGAAPSLGAEPYYGHYAGGGAPFAPAGYAGDPYGRSVDGRLAGLGLNQSYFGGGYDPAAVAAQQQQAAYQQQAAGNRYLPPPR